MKTVIDFHYDVAQSEKSKKICYSVKAVELDVGEGSKAPTMCLRIDLSQEHLDLLFDQVKLSVECANESGEDPYDATVELDSSQQAITFSGNLSNVLRHAEGFMLNELHIAAIEEAPSWGIILEKGKQWYVGNSGKLEMETPTATFPFAQLALFSGGSKRSYDEEFDHVQAFECTIPCK